MRADDYISIREALLERAITKDQIAAMFTTLKGRRVVIGAMADDKRLMGGIEIRRKGTIEEVYPTYILVRIDSPFGEGYLKTVDKIDIYSGYVDFKILED